MKFDYIAANPPYQGLTRSIALWQKVTLRAFDVLKDGAEMSIVHPGGWKIATDGEVVQSGKDVLEVRDMILNHTITQMTFCGNNDGKKTFNAQTTYDFYTIKKEKSKTPGILKVNTNSEKDVTVDFSKYKYPPVDHITKFKSFIDSNDKIECVFDGKYTKRVLVKEQDEKNKVPVIMKLMQGDHNWAQCVNYSEELKESQRCPKLIVSRGGTYTFLDEKGEYGVGVDGFYIKDTLENLKKIKLAFENEEFKKMLSEVSGSNVKGTTLDHKRLSRSYLYSLNKDFYNNLK